MRGNIFALETFSIWLELKYTVFVFILEAGTEWAEFFRCCYPLPNTRNQIKVEFLKNNSSFRTCLAQVGSSLAKIILMNISWKKATEDSANF